LADLPPSYKPVDALDAKKAKMIVDKLNPVMIMYVTIPTTSRIAGIHLR